MTKLRKTTLGAVVSEGGGSIRTGPFGSQLHASDYVEHGIPCIMPANMKDRRVNLDGIARISEGDANRLSKHLVKSGDIVYSRRGDVTQKALISPTEEGFFCGTGCLLIRPGSKIDSTFLAYYLSTPVNESWIVQQAVGATMPNLNTGILERVPLALPHSEDQKRIANVLSALDAKIELNNQINAELEAMAKLLYDYWFVQFDFPMTAAQAASLGRPALEGKPYKSSGGKMVQNPTLNRQIPEGWTANTIASCSKLNELVWTDKTAPESLKYVDLANTKNGSIQEVNDYKWSDAPSRARRKLRAGDTIVGTVRPGNRSYCLVPQTESPLTGSTGFAVLTPTKDCYREFNYLSLTSTTNINRLTTLASGAAYPAVNPDVVASYEIPFPPETLVDRYHATVKDSFDLMQVNQKQNQELTQLRDWLLPMLMNGQVTVGA